MKDYDETEAIEAMMQVLAADRRDEDATFEILDLIYEYYERHGDLDINMDDDDDDAEADIEAMTAEIAKQLRRTPAAIDFTAEEIAAMIKAEIEYQDSLL